MASKTKSPDEQPKAKIAKQVIAQKQKYFVSELGIEVEATSPDEAVELAKKQAAKPKDGDV